MARFPGVPLGSLGLVGAAPQANKIRGFTASGKMLMLAHIACSCALAVDAVDEEEIPDQSKSRMRQLAATRWK